MKTVKELEKWLRDYVVGSIALNDSLGNNLVDRYRHQLVIGKVACQQGFHQVEVPRFAGSVLFNPILLYADNPVH